MALAIAILAHRVHGRNVAKHLVRTKILELTKKNSYVTIDMVARKLAVKRTTAVWYLTLLTDVRLLATSKMLNKQIYYKESWTTEAILAFLQEAAQGVGSRLSCFKAHTASSSSPAAST